jgi:hypothetical protein
VESENLAKAATNLVTYSIRHIYFRSLMQHIMTLTPLVVEEVVIVQNKIMKED